jgi:hypothetical protein
MRTQEEAASSSSTKVRGGDCIDCPALGGMEVVHRVAV